MMRMRTPSINAVLRLTVGAGQIRMAMALHKWPCTTVWLIFMSTLLHLVLSCGESFAYASIITGVHVHALVCAICHYLLSTLNACGKNIYSEIMFHEPKV